MFLYWFVSPMFEIKLFHSLIFWMFAIHSHGVNSLLNCNVAWKITEENSCKIIKWVNKIIPKFLPFFCSCHPLQWGFVVSWSCCRSSLEGASLQTASSHTPRVICRASCGRWLALRCAWRHLASAKFGMGHEWNLNWINYSDECASRMFNLNKSVSSVVQMYFGYVFCHWWWRHQDAAACWCFFLTFNS